MSEELKWAYDRIQPDISHIDAKDHELAKLRYIINKIQDQLTELYFDTEDKTNSISVKLGNLLYTSDETYNIPDGTLQSELNEYAEKYSWQTFKETMSSTGYHCGDCTAFSATCLKCFTEQFYNTKTIFTGKHDGHKAFAIFMKHKGNYKS